MNPVAHTEPRSSIASSPKHCRNWPTRKRFVTRHRRHFAKQRLHLATQTTIGFADLKERRVQSRTQYVSAMLAGRRLVEALTPRPTSTKGSSATARLKPSEICCD